MTTLTSVDHIHASPERVWQFLTHLHEGGTYPRRRLSKVNVIINSDFKWPLLAVAALWAAALVLFWRGK